MTMTMPICLNLVVLALSYLSFSSVEAFTARGGASSNHRGNYASLPSLKSASARWWSKALATTTTLRMSDFDFPSAMPIKPELTMMEKLEESATHFIADISSRLDDGVLPPPELEALRNARDADDSTEQLLALRIYELMIEQGMTFDIDAETGRLKPTQFNIQQNLDVPEVKGEFKHLYSYGMELIRRGLIDLETCKQVVKKRLIDRTGLSPEEFDKWLGY
ncbi:hypothetical protein ACHAXH_001452 [Discostella pseudostelligera]